MAISAPRDFQNVRGDIRTAMTKTPTAPAPIGAAREERVTTTLRLPPNAIDTTAAAVKSGTTFGIIGVVAGRD
jgi:hypothetical protein